MPNTYEDRGIIKWAPFDALVGFHGLLNELKDQLSRRERPVLSDDDYEALNRHLMQAINERCMTSIHYFTKGHIRQLYGRITKVDFTFKTITVDHQKTLSAQDLIAIECL